MMTPSSGILHEILATRQRRRGSAGRRVRIRVHLSDRPGALHHLTRILADQQANIVETLHNRSHYGVNLGDTVIDITLETRGTSHIQAISSALQEAGYKFERIA